eukprot:1515037-Rhodomonas_salina.1
MRVSWSGRADLAGGAPHGPHGQGTRPLRPPNLLDDGRNVVLRRARGLAGAVDAGAVRPPGAGAEGSVRGAGSDVR